MLPFDLVLQNLVLQPSAVLPPPPPPPPGLPPKSNDVEATDNSKDAPGIKENTTTRVLPPPPPPPHSSNLPPLPPRPLAMHPMQHDMLASGVMRFPPPPPPLDSRPSHMAPGVARPPPPPPPGLPPAQMSMAPYGVLPGPQPMIQPPFFPGPPVQSGEFTAFAPRPQPQQPSYVKSAAPTVVKRPLAQHTPELTAMVCVLLGYLYLHCCLTIV
jgi:hypothetical protein